jgi:hypothetical protein
VLWTFASSGTTAVSEGVGCGAVVVRAHPANSEMQANTIPRCFKVLSSLRRYRVAGFMVVEDSGFEPLTSCLQSVPCALFESMGRARDGYGH